MEHIRRSCGAARQRGLPHLRYRPRYPRLFRRRARFGSGSLTTWRSTVGTRRRPGLPIFSAAGRPSLRRLVCDFDLRSSWRRTVATRAVTMALSPTSSRCSTHRLHPDGRVVSFIESRLGAGRQRPRQHRHLRRLPRRARLRPRKHPLRFRKGSLSEAAGDGPRDPRPPDVRLLVRRRDPAGLLPVLSGRARRESAAGGRAAGGAGAPGLRPPPGRRGPAGIQLPQPRAAHARAQPDADGGGRRLQRRHPPGEQRRPCADHARRGRRADHHLRAERRPRPAAAALADEFTGLARGLDAR